MSELQESEGILTEPIPTIACPHCEVELDLGENELFEKFDCPSCGNELTTPGRFGDFILTRKLGMGGMGAVFLAIDEKLGREVALKVTQKKYGDDPKFLERFATEAQAMARFNHPNVVQIYSYGQEYGQPYMVTEYVTGGDLASQMVQGEGLDQAAILNVARDLAEGLQAAKDNGLIHGDIKPENVMFDERGNAKIMDFGLAKLDGGGEGKPKEVWGTPYYIAPEKAKKEGEDHLSDQYSLGAALYHTLAGHPPFDGETPRDVVVARLKDDAPPLWQVNSSVSKKTSAIIERMMSRSPSSRYPTYASMKADFNDAIQFAEARPGPYTYEEAVATKKKFPILPVLLGAGGLLAALLTVAAIAMMSAKDKPAPVPPGGGGTAAVPEPAKPQIITKSGRNDDFPFTTSQMKKLDDAQAFFKDGKRFQGETDLVSVLDKAEAGTLGRQWMNLFLAMNYKFQGNDRGYQDHLKKVIDQKTTYSTEAPPVVDPAHFAKYLKGDMSEQQFQSQKSAYPPRFKHLADYAGALRISSTNPEKVKERAGAYISGKGSLQENWPYVLQGQAKTVATQSEAVKSKFAASAKEKDKNRARSHLENLKKDKVYAMWRPVIDKEITKYPKSAPKPPPPKPTPPKPTPPKKDTPKPAPKDPVKSDPEDAVVDEDPAENLQAKYAEWEKPAAIAAKKRSFDGISGKLGSFASEDPAFKDRSDAVRSIYKDMPGMHAEVVKRAKSVRFQKKVGNQNGKLIDANEDGVVLSLQGGGESTVGWDQLTSPEYFGIAQQVFQKSGLPAKVKGKHLLTLAYLAKLENDRGYGGAFANGARKLDPSLGNVFRKL